MKFRNLKTTGFAATRSRLGLSQQQLAEQLGISKATIGMAETGRRNLPVAALIKLAQLEIKMNAAQAPGQFPKRIEIKTESQSSFQWQSIAIRELECELQIQKLSDLLQTMRIQYQTYQGQLEIVSAVLEKESKNEDTILTLNLKLHRDRLFRQLQKCSITEQSLLQNKITLLSAESHLNKSVRQQMNSQ